MVFEYDAGFDRRPPLAVVVTVMSTTPAVCRPYWAGNAPVSYLSNVSGLQPGTTYYYCALASERSWTANGCG